MQLKIRRWAAFATALFAVSGLALTAGCGDNDADDADDAREENGIVRPSASPTAEVDD